jgi:SAM-dependent methyltransferase
METRLQPSLAQDYAVKTPDYYRQPRSEMLPFLPASCHRLLDVGCGNGEFAVAVKARLHCETWGIEPDPNSARQAVGRLDRFFEGCFSPDMDLPAGHFDCIVFNDVLEHMLDPASALRHARRLLSPKGSVVASIPNIGHFPTIWNLVMKGQWEYVDEGILDRTHLRFFTRSSILSLFERESFHVERIAGINPFSRGGRSWLIYRLMSLWPSAGIRDMRYLQFAIVARLPQ